MRSFLMNEEGNLTVPFSILTPLILFYFMWTVSTWQARYIQLQTKAVIDFALLGGASTGVVEKYDNLNNPSYYIPVRNTTESSEEYGADVAYNLLCENAQKTLPSDVANQLINMGRGYWDSEDEILLQLSGIMHFKAENIKYRTLVPAIVANWTFTIESTARCIPL